MPIEEVDLHGLVDDEISAEQRHKVEEHLLRHPEDAALVENWRRQNAALRAAFEPVAQETPPLSLRNAAVRNAAAGAPPIETGAIHWGRPSGSSRSMRRPEEGRESRRQRSIFSVAAALLVGAAVAGAAVLVLARPTLPSAGNGPLTLAQGYVDRADVSYLTYAPDRRPMEFDGEHRGDLASALRQWVGLGFIPDLSSVGLRFLGGRIAPGLKSPAGFLLYEKPDGARVALYFERAGPRKRHTPLRAPAKASSRSNGGAPRWLS